MLSGFSIRNIPWVNLIPSHPGSCSVDNIQNNTQQKRYYEWDPQHELLTKAGFSSTTVEYAACQKQRSIPGPPQNNYFLGRPANYLMAACWLWNLIFWGVVICPFGKTSILGTDCLHCLPFSCQHHHSQTYRMLYLPSQGTTQILFLHKKCGKGFKSITFI